MISLENGIYVMELPEHGLRQDFDPGTRLPFASQAVAQAYEDALQASLAAAATATANALAAAEAAKLSAEVHLSVTASPSSAAVGASITFNATLKDGHGTVLPITQTFAVPIQDATGAVIRVKSIPMVNGTATVSLSFAASGYYQITQQCLNAKLPAMSIILDTPLEVTVTE